MTDPIPRTRREALRAGLTRFTPFKPCRRGHIGERDVIKGCLTCVRERGRRRDVARILNSRWAQALEVAIEAARATDELFAEDVVLVPSSHLGLALAHFVTKPRRENRAPSVQTIIGELDETLRISTGGVLLGAAEACGFILPLDRRQRISWERYSQAEVRLSPEAYCQRADIEEQLAGEDFDGESRPIADVPPVRIVISPNHDALEPEALLPEPAESIAAALEALQSTAWRVNPFVYKTLRALAAQVAADSEGRPASVVPRCPLSALQQAGYWSQLPRFYYRCRFDWRGRIYQLGGTMQYTSGADAGRALLEFADGGALTAEGRDWLAVHVATCFGLRGSYPERIAWTQKHSDKFAAVARDPLSEAGWRRAKEPYQFLAACDAWRQCTEDPSTPIHLPIAADATASILQQYSWLMRDVDLGAKVNLKPGPIETAPSDFYKLAEQWALPVFTAKATDDGMVYERSGREQLTRSQMKAGAWFFYGQTWGSLAQELGDTRRASAIRGLLRRYAPSAWRLSKWLRKIARGFVEAGQPITWTLPDGFRVHQANREKRTIKTEVWLWSWNGPWRLNPRKQELLPQLSEEDQVNGLPANLIHSFDACLLREIVRQAPTVTRWAVAHDCVGVHPNDRAAMHEAALRAIAWLYEPDRLAGLWQQWGIARGRIRHPRDLPAELRGGGYTFS